MIRILFVCTGNICRSPTAEGVFAALVRQAALDDRIAVDSAGTHGYHVGDPPDPRSRAAAERRGYDLSALRARKLLRADFANFDYLLAMDLGHLAIMEGMAPGAARAKVALFLDFAPRLKGSEVPDPYYGGADGFERVLDLIEDGSRGLLAHIRERHLALSFSETVS